jgi:adenylate cyclase
MRGFSTVTEGMKPDRVVHLVNTYLSAVAETLVDRGATIDKFIGDAVMAFWNAPIAQPDHAAIALGPSPRWNARRPAHGRFAGGGPAARAGRHRAQHRQGLCGADGVARPAQLYLRRRCGDAGRTAGGADAQLWRVELRRPRGAAACPPGYRAIVLDRIVAKGFARAVDVSVIVPNDADRAAAFAECAGRRAQRLSGAGLGCGGGQASPACRPR